MFSLKDNFKFLDDGIDFPFYNDVPKLSTADWAIVLISVILVIITISLLSSHHALKSVMIFLITIIPALYICKRNYGLFFKRIRLKDIKTIILSFLGYILYVMLIATPILALMHYPLAGNGILPIAEQLVYLSVLLVHCLFLEWLITLHILEEFFKYY